MIKDLHDFTFHITPYDLVLLGSIFIGLTFILLLWFAPIRAGQATAPAGLSVNRQSRTCGINGYFALALLTIILRLIILLVDPAWAGQDAAHTAHDPAGLGTLQFSLALGPLIYFYSLKTIRPEYLFRRRDMLHFVPLLLFASLLLFAPLLLLPVWFFNIGMQLLATISVSIYLYRSYFLIKQFYKLQKFSGGVRNRHELRWFNRQLIGFGFLWLLWIAGMDLYAPLNLLLGVLTVWMAAAAFLRPEPLVSKSSLSGELWQKGIWLKKAMETNKYYQDPDLSLSSLAETLNIHPHELSRIINLALRKNFTEFINEYRIRQVTRKMKDPASDRLTLLGIALDAGFNSKTTFNRIFKQATGKTAAEFKNDLKNKRPSYHLDPFSNSTTVISYLKAVTMFKNYFKIAFRNLARNKVYS
ncbi:MAG TPA: helix-turn-helix domain-containing protein, partial [Puia sp.]|nr:helix-turn-helix domain-containing protein [Puia sp.]